MKISTIIVTVIALLAPTIVVPPTMTAIKNRSATITADVVEAAPAPIATTLTAKAVEHHSFTGGIMGVAAQRPASVDIERCKRQVRHTRVPKRQSITDDMDAKYVAAINASNAQATVVQKCLDSLR